MKALIVTTGLAMLSALATAAPMQPAGAPLTLTDIRWDILPPDRGAGDEPRLRVRCETSNSTLALEGSRPEPDAAKQLPGGRPGPVSFVVEPAAGRHYFRGHVSRRPRGRGGCGTH